MFILQEKPIDIPVLTDAFSNNAYGAMTTFEGLVRADKTETKEVRALLYIADHALCQAEGKKIVEEAKQRFPIERAVCVQRHGEVPVGSSAIWIAVWSVHRAQCFDATSYIIENVKKRLVIWKKEILTNGSSKWIYGAQTPLMV